MSSLRDALEAALVADPDDRAAHHAYADYLQEQGDPRGEFIQVQLALEEGGQPDDVRRRLRQRERELLAEHQREWLGPLGDALTIQAEKRRRWEIHYEVFFARGWPYRLVLDGTRTSRGPALAELLGRTPQMRLLRELILRHIDLAGVRAVIQSPYLRNLGRLQIRRSDLGDVGCSDLVTSGGLRQLRVLELRHCAISDDGARTLADCPDLSHLELLDINGNALTQKGIDDLHRVLGPALRADYQQTSGGRPCRRPLPEGNSG